MKAYLIKLIIFTILLILSSNKFNIYANDGVFIGAGNQLIPLLENNISVQKEVLSIKKKNSKFRVNVYYEFYNPDSEKEVLVGFEAPSPGGAIDFQPINGKHPYMYDFCVMVDGKSVDYNVAYVKDSNYIKNGIIKGKPLQQVIAEMDEFSADFFYVYNFSVKFRHGITKISHTYTYNSSGIYYYEDYSFNYNLTPAIRWANRQIDDFTLILDIGDFEYFNINNTFYNDKNDWIINGIGNAFDKESSIFGDSIEKITKFNMQEGYLIFQKKNFKPAGELIISSEYGMMGTEEFNPASKFYTKDTTSDYSQINKKILKNYPFARRGLIFKNKELNEFYKKCDWYIPNQNYVPSFNNLTDEEKLWMMQFK